MKVKVLYVSGGYAQGQEVQDRFINQCNGVGGAVSITLNLLGVSGLESQKKRGFNVLFLDFSIIESDPERCIRAANTFFKKEPENPIIILCDDNKQLVRAMSNKKIESLTSYVFGRQDDKDFQNVCNVVTDFMGD